MPICHCGGSGILRGLIGSFYKTVIQRCGAPKNLVNKRSFANAQDDINRHSEGVARRIPLNKRSFTFVQDENVTSLRCGGSLCKDDKVYGNDWKKRFFGCHTQNGIAKKAAFTLAEMLITLGIIGVIAAMTLPGLLAEYSKLVVETKLKKFYSQINQAIQLAESEYGPKESWYNYTNNVNTDADGKPIPGSSTAEKWFMKYIGSHMTVIKIEYDDLARPTYFFKDGSALKQMNASIQESVEGNMRDWTFYTTNPAKCLKLYGSEENARGKCSFQFLYAPEGENNLEDWKYADHIGKGFEPYKYRWGNHWVSVLANKCKSDGPEYCTAWIQMNGWKIPDDYPFKVSY